MGASTVVELDTRPPTLLLTPPSRVDPPEVLEFTVVADEDLGPVGVALRDSLGVLTHPGVQRTGPRTLTVSIPTVGLPQGPASLLLSVADEVLNFARTTVPVEVYRPAAFDVDLSVGGPYEEVVTVAGAYDTVITLSEAFRSSDTVDSAYEIEFTVGEAYQITLEVS